MIEELDGAGSAARDGGSSKVKKILTAFFLVVVVLGVAVMFLIGVYGGRIHRWSMGLGSGDERPDPEYPDLSKSIPAEEMQVFEEREAEQLAEE